MSEDAPKPLKSRSLAAPTSVQQSVPIPPLPGQAPTAAPPDDPWGSADGIPPIEIDTSGVVMDTLAQTTAPAPAESSDAFASLMEGAQELFALNDFTGALETVEKALELHPKDAVALSLVQRSQDALLRMFESKLGALTKRPRVRVNPAEIMWLNIDHRAGFVLSQIDGFLSYEEIIALSGMSRFETCRILAKLVEEGVIENK